MSSIAYRSGSKTAAAAVLAAGLGLSMVPMPAMAQGANPTVPSMIPEAASSTIYAKVRAIDPLTREVTMDTADGATVTVIAAPQVPLENVEVGDMVDVHYYRSVAFLVAKGTENPEGQATNLPPEQAGLLARHELAQVPGGTTVPMTHIVGLVVGVLMQAPNPWMLSR